MPEPYKDKKMPINTRPSLPSHLPCAPLDGKLYDARTEKSICSGHTLTVRTAYLITHPLPSWKLHEMQWILHQIAGLAGTAEPDSDDGDFPKDAGVSTGEVESAI